MITVLLAISVTAQFTAAVLAYRLSRVTGHLGGWLLLCGAILLMAVRRVVTLYQVVFLDGSTGSLLAESIALVISILLVVGLQWLRPFLRRQRESSNLIDGTEQQFRALFEASSVPALVVNSSGQVLQVSPAAAELLQLPSSKIGTTNLRDWLLPDAQEHFPVRLSQWLSGGCSSWETTLVISSGETVAVALEGRPLPNFCLAILIRDMRSAKLCEESARMYEQFLGSVEQSVVVLDQAGLVRYWNRFAEKLYGWNRADTIGKHILDLVPMAGRREIAPEITEAVTDGRVWEGELKVADRRGRTFPIRLIQYPWRDSSGALLGTIGISYEITKEVEQRKSLHEVTETFRAAASLAGDVIYEVDLLSGDVTVLSSQAGRHDLEDTTRRETLGSWRAGIHADDRERVWLAHEQLAQGLSSYDLVYRFQGEADKIVTVRDRAVCVRDTAGRPWKKVGVVTDLTEKLAAEQQLRASEESFRTLVEHLPDIIVRLDRQRRAILLSPHAALLCGIPVSQMLGRTMRELGKPPELCDLFDGILDNVFATGQIQVRDIVFPGVNGPTEYESRFIPEFGADGKVETVLVINRETTDRKRMLRGLEESEERFRALFLEAPIAYESVDIEGRILAVNNAWLEMLGYTREEVLGRSYFDFISPEMRPNMPAQFEQFKRSGRVDGAELELVCADKHIITVLLDGRVKYDDRGEFLRTHCVLTDITEKRHLHNALTASTQSAADLVNALPSGLLIFQYAEPSQFVLVDANPEASRLTGLSREQLVGQSIEELFGGGGVLNRITDCIEVMKTGHPRHFPSLPYTDERLNGWYRVHLFRLPGQRLGIAIEDVTALHTAGEALRDSETKYRQLAELSPDGIALLADRKFVYVNSAFVQMTGGRHADELTGREVADFVEPDDFKVLLPQVLALGEGMSLPPQELRVRKLDGTPVDVEVSVVRFSPYHGGVSQVIVRNITERKQAEMRRRQMAERLQSAERLETVGTLAASVAHEFNNLLLPVMGYAELMLGKRKPTDPHAEYLAEILRAGYRARDIVEQLLTFSCRPPDEQAPTLPKAILEEALALLEPRLNNRYQCHLEQGALDVLLLVDRLALIKAIVNLCEASLYLMSNGGTVTLGCRQIEGGTGCPNCGQQSEQSVCLITVKDTGPGLDAQTASRLFEPFFSTSRVGVGTGLGLASAHGIIRQHGGHLCVSSSPTGGTTYYVSLPLYKPGLSNQAAGENPRGIVVEHA